MSTRLILGTVLTLALSLSANLGNPGISENMPLGQGDSPRQGPLAPAPASSPAARMPLPVSIWETNDVRPLAVPRYSRFEAGRLSDRLLEQARRYLNTPYCRGASLRTGRATDCSGFVQYVYKKANIELPRASAEQALVGEVAASRMDFSRLTAGDLLFFRDGGQHIGHVGIYLGEAKMIHASNNHRGVTVSDLHQPYYLKNFVVAKRLLEESPGKTPPVEKTSSRPSIN